MPLIGGIIIIQIHLSTPDYSKTYTPVVTNLVWETHRKNTAGSLHITFLQDDQLYCELGYHIDLYELQEGVAEPEHILSYRVYEQSLRNDQELLVIAYDQLYQWVHSLETIRICRPRNLYQDGGKNTTKYLLSREEMPIKYYVRQWLHQKFMERMDQATKEEDTKLKKGVIASDLILRFAYLYGLVVDFIDYTDCRTPIAISDNLNWDFSQYLPMMMQDVKYNYSTYGYFPRVTKNESVLDIIQSYIDFNSIYLEEIYVLYDGGKGLCYRRMGEMRTYILITMDVMGEYTIHQTLPKEYANYVQFDIVSSEGKDQDVNLGESAVRDADQSLLEEWTPESRAIWYKQLEEQRAKEREEKLATMKKERIEQDYLNTSRIQQLGIFKNTILLEEETQNVSNQISKLGRSSISVLGKIGGVIQSPTTHSKGINPSNQEIYNRLLLFYNAMNESFENTLTLRGVKGSWKVRGGSILGIKIKTFNHVDLNIEVMVESVRHTYKSKDDYTMDIEVVRT